MKRIILCLLLLTFLCCTGLKTEHKNIKLTHSIERTKLNKILKSAEESLKQRKEEQQREMKKKKVVEKQKQKIIVEVSFYCNCSQCCDTGSNGIMANGEHVHVGACAAPQELPFGTILDIEGLGQYTVSDRGGAITTYTHDNGSLIYKLDIFLESHEECLRRGRYLTTAEIVN